MLKVVKKGKNNESQITIGQNSYNKIILTSTSFLLNI